MEEAYLLYASMAVLMSIAVTGLFEKAPYGRYTGQTPFGSSWMQSVIEKTMIPGRLAWFLQECPTLIHASLWYFMYPTPEVAYRPRNQLLLLLFVWHYTNRVIVFPLRSRFSKPTPIGIMLAAMLFCALNGYVQARTLTHVGNYEHVPLWVVAAGAVVFYAGWFINVKCDTILTNLRKPGEKKGTYHIPHGFLFEYVSGANFFGEIVEWWGYALASGFALHATVFAVTTTLVIGIRAVHHHQWYLTKFDDYPSSRKAVIPFLY